MRVVPSQSVDILNDGYQICIPHELAHDLFSVWLAIEIWNLSRSVAFDLCTVYIDIGPTCGVSL